MNVYTCPNCLAKIDPTRCHRCPAFQKGYVRVIQQTPTIEESPAEYELTGLCAQCPCGVSRGDGFCSDACKNECLDEEAAKMTRKERQRSEWLAEERRRLFESMYGMSEDDLIEKLRDDGEDCPF